MAPSSGQLPDEPITGTLAVEPSDGTGGVILPILVASAAAVLLAIIARRRFRGPNDAETTEPLPTAAAKAPTEGFVPAFLGAAAATEAHIPRWRRPSVAAARFETTNGNVVRAAAAAAIPPARLPLVFTAVSDGLTERLMVRYDSVALLDRPDDALGRTLGEVDSGDEVEVLERHDIWARVRTPNGADGWVPTMTLAAAATAEDLAIAHAEPAPDPADEAINADEPPPLEDLLAAIVAQRLARQQELANGVDQEASPSEDSAVAPKRPRARRPRTDRPAARKR